MKFYTYTATVRRRDGHVEEWESLTPIKAGSIERAGSIGTKSTCDHSRTVARKNKDKHGAIVRVSVDVREVVAP